MKKLMTLEAVTLKAGGTVVQPDFAFPNPLANQTATLPRAFSYRSRQDAVQEGRDTVLFLSDYSRLRISPDQIFNMASGSEDCFHALTARGNIATVAEAGVDGPLQTVSA